METFVPNLFFLSTNFLNYCFYYIFYFMFRSRSHENSSFHNVIDMF